MSELTEQLQLNKKDTRMEHIQNNSSSLSTPQTKYDEKILDSIAIFPDIDNNARGSEYLKNPISERGLNDTDIYRGEPPSESRETDHDQRSVAHSSSGSTSSSSSSSSSDSSINVGRRLGALASVVEAAISRWARTHSSASSTTSSSSSSTTSSVSSNNRTVTTRRRRGRRYSSTASIHNAVHERAILARKRAQEEFRVAPREFQLFLPPEYGPSQSRQAGGTRVVPSGVSEEQAKERRIIRTLSLPLILARLDSALKKSAKARRHFERTAASTIPSLSNSTKGKGRGLPQPDKLNSGSNSSLVSKTMTTLPHEKSWWLDVASPTWDDLRSIGKLLHLHPLTLEDILHRDPREKLELFPGLGYYFVVFRALESERSRERFRKFRSQSGTVTGLPGDDDVIGAVNVYLVVFREGICSFHYGDISEHTDKLHNRVIQLEHSFNMTSDWIAHGIMDSIVDSFFPALAAIEKEVKEMDSIVIENPLGSDEKLEGVSTQTTGTTDGTETEKSSAENSSATMHEEKAETKTKEDIKFASTSLSKLQTRIPSSIDHIRHVMKGINVRRLFKMKEKKSLEKESTMVYTSRTLARMAGTRRVVTSLGRLLGTKGEVIAQIRKRLVIASAEAYNSGLGKYNSNGGEVSIYMGDVQDHIATLQQSLNHYERVLSYSHPAYLSQLRVSQSISKGGTDNAILVLTVVSIIVLCIQVWLGLFSINIGKIPSNEHEAGKPFNVFFIILGVSFLIGFGVLGLVRYWQATAKKKFTRKI